MRFRPFYCSALATALLAGCQSQPSPTYEQPATARTNAPRPDTQRAGNGFDYFLLTLSWSPEYCWNHRGAAQCLAHATFVLHGLWPENRDGTYPENCGAGGAADAEDTGTEVYPDPRLARHEWQAHGTCSGMSPTAYFSAAGKAFHAVHIPDTFEHVERPLSLAPDDIAQQFRDANRDLPPGSVSVGCRNGYLTQVEVCLDKGLHAIACGQGLHGCTSAQLRVPAP